METQLEEDLKEAFDGFDPLELLIHDPELSGVAEDLFSNPVSDLGHFEENLKSENVADGKPGNVAYGKPGPDVGIKPLGSLNKSKRKDGSGTQTYCKVCHQAAECYVHYGALTCTSCRAFFSRAAKNRKFENFLCISDTQGHCPIDSKTYRTCKQCRFSKCLQSGMKIPEKYSSLNIDWYSDSYPYVQNLRKSLSFCNNVTPDERDFLRDIAFKRFKIVMERRIKFMRSDLTKFKHLLEWYYRNQTFPLNTSKAYEDFIAYGVIEALAESGEFVDNMTKRDRVRLLSQNTLLAQEFFDAYRLGMFSQKNTNFSQRINMILEPLTCSERKSFCDIKNDILQTGDVDSQVISYESMYDQKQLGIQPGEPARRHRKLVKQIAALNLNQTDPFLVTMIVSLILYTPDFVDLEQPEKAEHVQMFFASMLYRYLKGQESPRSDGLFRECVMASAYARELREFKEAAYKKNLGKV